MKTVQRYEITDTLKDPPIYGGRLDENGNSIFDNGRQVNRPDGRSTDNMSYLDRQQAHEDMATPDTALQKLVNAESELYLQGDGIDRRADERPADRHDNVATPDEALEHMKQAEANAYMQEV